MSIEPGTCAGQRRPDAAREGFSGEAGRVRWADPLDVMRKSRRFDLIFKVELARAWGRGDAGAVRRAEEAYLEMVRARNGFYERLPPKRTPADFIDGFRAVASSIRERGYDPRSGPVPLDANGEVLNGAHRLSACVAYGRECPVAVSERMSSGGSRLEVFLAGNIHPAVARWGMAAYLRLLPEGPLAPAFKAADGGGPFPDWTARAREMRSLQIGVRLRMLRYRLEVHVRRGRHREKVLAHLEELRCSLRAYSALAEYWSRRKESDERRY